MGYSIAEMPGLDVAAEDPASHAALEARLHVSAHTAPIAPLPLPAVPPLAARLARLVCHAGSAQCLERDAAVVEWQASVEDEAHDTRASFEQPGVLDLAYPAGAIRVLFDLAAFPALAIAALPDGSRAPVPGDTARALRTAVAGVLLAPLLTRLAALGLGAMHVAQLAHSGSHALKEADAGNSAAFDATFSLDGTRHRARVRVAAAVVEALEALHAARAATWTANAVAAHSSSRRDASASGLGSCMMPGRLILGSRRLPVDTLRALEPGDVLLRSLPGHLRALLPENGAGHVAKADAAHAAQVAEAADGHAAPIARPASATVAWGSPGLMRVHAQVNLEGRRLSLTKEPIMTDELDPVRPDDLLAPDQQSNPIDIGELDLPVQFEVDTVALPLSQLYALRPGYVLELPTPVAEAQLKLVTHGQTIGYGELVTVGDHLGIRILRMAHGDGPVQ